MKRIWVLLLIVALSAGAKFGYDYFYFDTKNQEEITKPISTVPVTPLVRAIEFPQSSPPLPSDLDVQLALSALGIPAGEADGKWGQRTRQGMCIWRELTGRVQDRNFPIDIERHAIVNTRSIKSLKLPDDFVYGLNVNKTCQSAVWVKDKEKKNFMVTIASTGAPGLDSDSGTFKIGWVVDRWYESIAYPDGWMYRPMFYNRGQAIHGSEYDTWVWWYPASHGCVRMLGKDIDALWAAGFGVKDTVRVYGQWNPYVSDPKP